jgi:hypothetical protein
MGGSVLGVGPHFTRMIYHIGCSLLDLDDIDGTMQLVGVPFGRVNGSGASLIDKQMLHLLATRDCR